MGANASKHEPMSYGRMNDAETKLEEEVQKLLEEAERIDAEEDARRRHANAERQATARADGGVGHAQRG
jgi:vacuolar-type H+-ATPase subunit H